MESIFEVIGLLVAFLLAIVTIAALIGGIVMICYHFFSYSIDVFSFSLFGRDIYRYIDFFPARLTISEESVLIRNFQYYKSLPSNLQDIFKNRLKKFADSKTFETRKGLLLTEEMKILVSASAIQLTFGLRKYRLPDFKRIIIYPEQYYSLITKKFHKGEANAHGLIVLSWKDFKEGYIHSDDNLNLGLHEFAHALFISFLRDITEDMNFLSYYEEWRKIGDQEFFKLRKGENKYLRSYGGTNLMEFFSVCIEHFFETPKEFNENIPRLYQILVKLLGQNPKKWIK